MRELPLRHVALLGYRVIDEPPERIAKVVCDRIQARAEHCFSCLNPHSIVVARDDPTLQSFFRTQSELLCDGVGLSIANRILNRRSINRVWGQDFFLAVSREMSARRSGRVLFLGGHPDWIQDLVAKYRQDFPGLTEISTHVPPFKSEFSPADIEEMARAVSAFNPDILWIGVGSPKQEKLLCELQKRCHVPCGAAIGAVFDFYCGRVKLGPKWIRDAGLLWAYRLIKEPRRLWRRTFLSAPRFAGQVFLQLVRRE